jgi:hypothetical protein
MNITFQMSLGTEDENIEEEITTIDVAKRYQVTRNSSITKKY